MMESVWAPIRGFASLGEYGRFKKYIEGQVSAGVATEIPPDPTYGPGELFGGRWFVENDTQEIWRLIEPDFPFKGVWEPVTLSA